jgi:hypothetical protein
MIKVKDLKEGYVYKVKKGLIYMWTGYKLKRTKREWLLMTDPQLREWGETGHTMPDDDPDDDFCVVECLGRWVDGVLVCDDFNQNTIYMTADRVKVRLFKLEENKYLASEVCNPNNTFIVDGNGKAATNQRNIVGPADDVKPIEVEVYLSPYTVSVLNAGNLLNTNITAYSNLSTNYTRKFKLVEIL